MRFDTAFLNRLEQTVSKAFERDLARITAETDRCIAKAGPMVGKQFKIVRCSEGYTLFEQSVTTAGTWAWFKKDFERKEIRLLDSLKRRLIGEGKFSEWLANPKAFYDVVQG